MAALQRMPQLGRSRALSADNAGNVYIADLDNHVIRRVDPGGTISTVAGTGTPGFSGDSGPATAAQLNRPGGVHVDGAGNLYIGDTSNHRIRQVDPSGTITTIAGKGFTFPTFSGDGVPATLSSLHLPTGTSVDQGGDLYIADWQNHRVRKVTNVAPPTNQAPVADAGGPYNVNEGGSALVVGTGSDPDEDPLTYAWDLDDNGSFETPGQSVTFSASALDGPSAHTITVQVTDDAGLTATDQTTVDVLNVAPTVDVITAPVDPVQVGTEIAPSATFTDPGTPDTHTASFDWGDTETSAGTVSETGGSGSASGSHTYTDPGVYTVTLTVTDDDDSLGVSIYQFVVVYDPSAGFVTGGGWIDSPVGAYTEDPSATGKANFGFVSKYKKGANTPTGQTQFKFKAGDLKFNSTVYDWLVVAGPHAKFKGSGTINNSGDFGFMLTGTDGQVTGGEGEDKFRIKIWDAMDVVVYDNQFEDAENPDAADVIEGGSIVIHSGGSASKPTVSSVFGLQHNIPNPLPLDDNPLQPGGGIAGSTRDLQRIGSTDSIARE